MTSIYSSHPAHGWPNNGGPITACPIFWWTSAPNCMENPRATASSYPQSPVGLQDVGNRSASLPTRPLDAPSAGRSSTTVAGLSN